MTEIAFISIWRLTLTHAFGGPLPLRYEPVDAHEFSRHGLRLLPHSDGVEIFHATNGPDFSGTWLQLRMQCNDDQFLLYTSLGKRPFPMGIHLAATDQVTMEPTVPNGTPAELGVINLKLPAKASIPRELSWHFETFEAPVTWHVTSHGDHNLRDCVLCDPAGVHVAEGVAGKNPNGEDVYMFTTTEAVALRSSWQNGDLYALKFGTGAQITLPMPAPQSQDWSGGALAFHCHVML